MKRVVTESAKREAVSSTVVLRALLHSDGSVIDIELISGLPRGLAEGAIDAAQKIKFIPALKDGNSSMRVQLEYNFNLY